MRLKVMPHKQNEEVEQTAWKKAKQQERENARLSKVLVKTPNTVRVVRGDSCERVYDNNVEESAQRFRKNTRRRALRCGCNFWVYRV